MTVLPVPLRLSIDVTTACNLSCRHCRHHGTGAPQRALSFAAIARVLDEASEMAVCRLAISGGEPFLRNDTVAILLRALRGRVGRVSVSTSALPLDGWDLGALLDHHERLTFKISLDGPPHFHDRLRGLPGACARTAAAIQRLVAAGFDVQVTTTLMRDNVRYLRRLLDRVSDWGCSGHHVVELIPVGRASVAMGLTAAQRSRAGRTLQKASSRSGCSLVARLPFAGRGRGLSCSGGTEECGILADGSVVGCRLIPGLVEGNITRTSLGKIWSDRRRFLEFRELAVEELPQPCRSCRRAARCLGGCHAYALGATGRFHDGDPRCPSVAAAVRRPERSIQ